MFMILLLLIGAFFIISNEDLKMNSKDNFDEFSQLYFKWMDGLIGNSVGIAGHVVKMDWLPEIE